MIKFFFEKEKLTATRGAPQKMEAKFKFTINPQGIRQFHVNCQIARRLTIFKKKIYANNHFEMLNSCSDTIVDMVYLDFSKAFDKVDHGILLHKVKELSITGKLGQWFYHFLTNRKHFVRLPGGVSGDHPVISGVPQGTVLGPLLFIIMIADINKDIACSKLTSFADDTRVYKQISDTEDCDSLQRDLTSVYKWASDNNLNNMFFNAKKFHFLPLSASQASNKSNVYINPSMDIIPQFTDVPDLGINRIIISKDCSFDSHISSLSRKCNNLAGWILRSFVSHDKLTMLTLFKSLVISRLDYTSQLWSPHKISQITLIEKVQRSFTKHIPGMRDLSYHERLQALRD